MKYSTLVSSALTAFTILAASEVRADNFITITPTGTAAATVTNRWAIGSGLSGLSYIDGNSGMTGATATNFFTITGAAIPLAGSPAAFTSYIAATGTATVQSSAGNALTPDSYSGLTYVAGDLSLTPAGPLNFYAIHHRSTGDYLAQIRPANSTVVDQKPMSVAGTLLTPGGTGYFALSFAADNPNAGAGWNAGDFYYLRTDTLTGHTWFGSMIPALLSGPTDRYDLGLATLRGYTDLAYTSTNVGLGAGFPFGASQFYYLRLDPITHTTFFGRLDPLTGTATDIQDLGGVYRTLVFTTTNVGYGADNFYSIGRAAQTITFAAVPSHTACDASFTVNPTASSGLVPVTLAVTSGPATISGGNVVTLTGAGTVVLTASQAGDASFAPAPDVAQSFAVTACVVPLTAQTIIFAPIPAHTACDAAFTLAPTATSGLPVTLAVTSGPATLAGNIVTLTGTGTVTVQATQAGDGTYSSATPVSQTFAVAACIVPLVPQTITFAPIPAHTACDAAFILSPTASSGLPVTLTVASGPATLVGNTVTLTGTGSVTLWATQAGDGTYSSASSAVQTFAVTACVVPLIPQTIAFAAIPAHTACDASILLSPTATSGLPVTLAVTSGPATLVGNTVTLTGTGSVTLQATQGGDGTYSSATPVSQTFAVTACIVPLLPQTITFAPIPGHTACESSFMVSPTASSGLPVSLTVTSGPATVSGNTVTITGAGSVTLLAVQAGNSTYAGATPVSQTFVVAGAPVITNNPLTAAGVVGVPFSFTLTASGSPTGYTAFNLPAGLFLNPVTGVISGTPTAPDLPESVVRAATIGVETPPRKSLTIGPTFVTITATNGTCVSPSVYLIITIVASSAPVATPIITNSPLTASGTVGTSFNFAITASGSPTGYTAFNLPPGLSLNPLTGVISGTPTQDNNTTFATLTATNALGASPGTYLVIKIGNGSAISGQPANTIATMGGSATFSVGSNGEAAVTYQWRKDGVDLSGATSATLAINNVQPANVGFYTVVSSSGNGTATTTPALLEMSFPGQIAGSAIVAAATIQHPNGNIYDQVLLTGASASVKANAGESVRVSYVDLTDDIVQVEFSGAGVLTINLDNASGPAAPVNYNQAGVLYMKGHASIAITGANDTSNVSIFSVGSLTALNQSLFRAGVAYDGWADLELVTVATVNGHFGGVRTANANYFRTTGMTGLYAPGVQFGGPVYLGDIDAAGNANAVLMLGSVADARITGGDLFQDNGGSIEVSGMTRLQFTAGTSSGGALIPAQVNRSRLVTGGVEVTGRLVAP